MKSMMQEAASIMKAIEQAWTKAGKPRSFSVKIFEDAEHGFFGLSTKKNAKVGIFFDQADIMPTERIPRQKPLHTPSRSTARQKRTTETQRPTERPKRPVEKRPRPTEQTARPVEKPEQKKAAPKKEFWTDDMIGIMEQNIKEQLSLIGHTDKAFSLRANRYYLKCHFTAPLFTETEREKQLFRSWAHLMMHALRHKLKKQLRGFKLVLSSG